MLLLFCLAVRLDSQPSQGRTLRILFGLHIIPLYMTLWIPQEVQHHLSWHPRHMNGVRY